MQFTVWTLTTDSDNGLHIGVYPSQLRAYEALRGFLLDGSGKEAENALLSQYDTLLLQRDYGALAELAAKVLEQADDSFQIASHPVEVDLVEVDRPTLPERSGARLACLTDDLMALEHDLEAVMAERNIDYHALGIEARKSEQGEALYEANGVLYEAYDLLERSTSKLYSLYPQEQEIAAGAEA